MTQFLSYFSLGFILINGLSLPAKHHWFCDLLAHFKIQYFLIGIALTLTNFFMGNYALAVLIAGISIFLFWQIQSPYYGTSTERQETPNFSLVQFNKFYFNKKHHKISAWLQKTQPDIVLVNEALQHDIAAFKNLNDLFPHQYPEAASSKFHNIAVLSRHPIKVEKTVPGGLEDKRPVLKITLQKPSLEPLIIYAHHATVPAGGRYSKRRNEGLKTVAQRVSACPDKNVIMTGDWNMTPFSTHFGDILKISGLRTAKSGWLPLTTWPSFFVLPWLKIPIDHVLFSKAIGCVEITKAPSLGSDHHPVLAKFKITAL